jgi:hypothetical protein
MPIVGFSPFLLALHPSIDLSNESREFHCFLNLPDVLKNPLQQQSENHIKTIH